MSLYNIDVKPTIAKLLYSNPLDCLELKLKYADSVGLFNRKVNHRCFEDVANTLHVFYNNDGSINNIQLYCRSYKNSIYHVYDAIYKRGSIWKKIYHAPQYSYSKVIYIYKDERIHNVEIYDKNNNIIERKYFNYDAKIIRHHFYDDNGNNIGNIIETELDEA